MKYIRFNRKSPATRILVITLLVVLASCSKRDLVYFSNLSPSEPGVPVKNYVAPKIQPDDILTITVSSLSPESNVIFNNVILPNSGNIGSVAERITEGYLVDKNGFINFPVIGKIALAGLTKEEAQEKMTDLIKVQVKNPIVNVRFRNFKVTVVGEVNKPATFTVETEKINVIEALGLAGDMTAFGHRDNVLIIREKDGIRTTTRINLNSKEVLSSPYFYLQQNDVVYVEPDNREKNAALAPGNRFLGLWAALISTAGFVIITILDNN